MFVAVGLAVVVAHPQLFALPDNYDEHSEQAQPQRVVQQGEILQFGFGEFETFWEKITTLIQWDAHYSAQISVHLRRIDVDDNLKQD